MAAFTENAIKDAFRKLLDEKAYSSITVKDIAEECGINRNTFYYHFQDIPDLLDMIIMEECDRIMKEYPKLSSLEECLNVAVDFTTQNKQSLIHIYNSVDRTVFESNLWRICDYVVRSYLEDLIKKAKADKSDGEIIIRFYKCECFGQVMAWMEEGMKDDIGESFSRICELKKGQIEELIDRSSRR